MRISNEDILTTATQSLDSSFNSRPIWLGHIAQYAIQLVFTGTPQGNFKLQASCDKGSINSQAKDSQDNGIVNWTDIDDSAQTISAAGTHMWNAENVGYQWVRVVWTQTGSTGTLTSAKFMGKGI